MTSNQAIARLRTTYKGYDKNSDIYIEIKDKINIAIENAKKLEDFHKKNGQTLQVVEANPSTEVYKIVEELIK